MANTWETALNNSALATETDPIVMQSSEVFVRVLTGSVTLHIDGETRITATLTPISPYEIYTIPIGTEFTLKATSELTTAKYGFCGNYVPQSC